MPNRQHVMVGTRRKTNFSKEAVTRATAEPKFSASADPQKAKSRVSTCPFDKMSLPPLRPLLSSYATRGPRSIPRHPPLLLSLPLLSQLHSRGLSSSGPQVQQPPQKGQSSTARQRYPVSRRNARGNHRRKGLWKNVKEIKAAPKLLVLRVEDMDKPMADAASKRWNGRRSLYLGSWKNRRDAAFIKNETRGIPFERTGHPVIDGVLGRETRQVDSYPCIKLEKPPTKDVEKVPGFRIAADSRGV
jgi:hypothetical protein